MTSFIIILSTIAFTVALIWLFSKVLDRVIGDLPDADLPPVRAIEAEQEVKDL